MENQSIVHDHGSFMAMVLSMHLSVYRIQEVKMIKQSM